MTKQTKAKPISEQQFDEAFKTYKESEEQKATVTAQLNQAVSKASEKYNQKLKDLATASANAEAVVKQYCEENKILFEGAERSFKTAYGTVGYRTTPYAVRINDGIKPEDIIKALKKKGLEMYIVTKEDLDKKALVANRNEPKLQKALTGLAEIEQGEAFFIKL